MLKALNEEALEMSQDIKEEAVPEGAKAKAQKTRSEKCKGKRGKAKPKPKGQVRKEGADSQGLRSSCLESQ